MWECLLFPNSIPCFCYQCLFLCPHERTLWVVNFCKTKINHPLFWVCYSLLFQGKDSKPFPKLIFQMAEVVFLIRWIWLSHQNFWLSLMVDCPECCCHLNFCFCVQELLFISVENLFLILIGMVFSNRFF